MIISQAAGGAVLATVLADGENKKSGPIGLALILVLCVACYFLFKSMSKHLRKVREEFPTDTPPAGTGSDTSAAVSPPAASAGPSATETDQPVLRDDDPPGSA